MEHIETIELGSSQSSITFSSIPQDYDDLIIFTSARADNAATYHSSLITFNNDTATNYSEIRLLGLDSGVATSSRTSQSNLVWLYIGGGGDVANVFGNASLYISNYTSTASKSISSDYAPESGTSQFLVGMSAGLYNGTSITSMEMAPASGNFVAGSTFYLYGVTAGGDGTVTTS